MRRVLHTGGSIKHLATFCVLLAALSAVLHLALSPGVLAQQSSTVQEFKPVDVTKPSSNPNQGTSSTFNIPNMTLTPSSPAPKPGAAQPLTVSSGTGTIR